MAKEDSTRCVSRIISVLNCFSPEQPELSSIEIVKKTSIPIATTYRLLNGLRTGHFLKMNTSSGKYSIGSDLYFCRVDCEVRVMTIGN